jgi:hypothetical protein
VEICECPNCRGTGRILTGYSNSGGKILSDCARCQRAGFVPLVDGAATWPFRDGLADPPPVGLRKPPRPTGYKQREMKT